MPDGDARGPVLDWRWVESCRAAGGVPTLELFDEALEAGREAVPLLSRVLARRSWRDAARLEESALSLHALRLLGGIASPSAIPVLLSVLEDPIDPGRHGEEAAVALGRIGREALPSLERIVLDVSEDAWTRGAAARGLMHAALRDRRLRADVLAAYERVLLNREDRDRLAVALVVHCVRMLAAVDLVPLIDEAFRAGRVDEDFIGWNDLLVDLVARRYRPDAVEKQASRRDLRRDYVPLATFLAGLDADVAARLEAELARLRVEGAEEPPIEDDEADEALSQSEQPAHEGRE